MEPIEPNICENTDKHISRKRIMKVKNTRNVKRKLN